MQKIIITPVNNLKQNTIGRTVSLIFKSKNALHFIYHTYQISSYHTHANVHACIHIHIYAYTIKHIVKVVNVTVSFQHTSIFKSHFMK